YWTGKVPADQEHFQRVFETIGGMQSVHSKAQLDLTNIESVFTALDLGKVIKSVPGLKPGEIPRSIASLKRLIVKTLELTIEFPIVRDPICLVSAPPPYREFADLVDFIGSKATPAHGVSIITFNYDVAVDVALHRAGIGPDYVIAGKGANQRVRLL